MHGPTDGRTDGTLPIPNHFYRPPDGLDGQTHGRPGRTYEYLKYVPAPAVTYQHVLLHHICNILPPVAKLRVVRAPRCLPSTLRPPSPLSCNVGLCGWDHPWGPAGRAAIPQHCMTGGEGAGKGTTLSFATGWGLGSHPPTHLPPLLSAYPQRGAPSYVTPNICLLNYLTDCTVFRQFMYTDV